MGLLTVSARLLITLALASVPLCPLVASAEPAPRPQADDPAAPPSPPDTPAAPNAAAVPPADEAAARAEHEALRAEHEALRAEHDALRDEHESLREEQAALAERVVELGPFAGRLNGYLDLGFFSVGGDGSGVRQDLAHAALPAYDGVIPGAWVLLGDPLATAVNSRGEPADLGTSRAFPIDGIDSDGHPTFLVNTLAVGLYVDAGDRFTMTARLAVAPRAHSPAADAGLDDHVALDLGYLRWLPALPGAELQVFVGKAHSLLGIEYRAADAPERIGITPSLLCRYTCGHPTGLQVRTRWLDRRLVASLGVSNGSQFADAYFLHDELDANAGKTLSGRLAWRLPIGRGIEVGVSGALGAQDEQPDDALWQWHGGADLHVDWGDFLLEAEWVKGRAPGAPLPGAAPGDLAAACGVAACLRYRGAYGQLAWFASPRLTPYARIDWRDAEHRDGDEFLYVADGWRATVGVRARLGVYVMAKAEYVAVRELGLVPYIPNDVFTTSLVLSY